MASRNPDYTSQLYDKLLNDLWFQGFLLLYVGTLSVFILYAGIEVSKQHDSLSRVEGRFVFADGINIEANQSNACKQCSNNNVIVSSGVSMFVDPATTQFTGGLLTPCLSVTSDSAEITRTTNFIVTGASDPQSVPMRGNLTVSPATGLVVPQYVQNCTTSSDPTTCLPFNTTFCDETDSAGSIYIHRRINMGAGQTTNLTHYCACILTPVVPGPGNATALYCTEPFGPL